MSNPLASIIIPIYNAENYIGKCLDCVLSQSYDNLEVICIDDGSKDKSFSVLQSYKEKFPDKLNIHTQQNMGVGKTRNKGIKLATGEYIFFVDNDDKIEHNYIEKHIVEAEKNNADMVISGYKRVDENGNCIYFDKTKSSSTWEPFKRLAPWGRVYRRSFLIDNGLEFLDNMIGEDDYINILAAIKTDKVITLDYVGYYWTFNTKSISNTQHVDPKLSKAAAYLLESIYNNIDLSSLTSEKRTLVEYVFIKLSVWFCMFYGKKISYQDLISAYELMFGTTKKCFPDYSRNSLVGLFTPKGESLRTRGVIYLFIVLEKMKLIKVFLKIYNRH